MKCLCPLPRSSLPAPAGRQFLPERCSGTSWERTFVTLQTAEQPSEEGSTPTAPRGTKSWLCTSSPYKDHAPHGRANPGGQCRSKRPTHSHWQFYRRLLWGQTPVPGQHGWSHGAEYGCLCLKILSKKIARPNDSTIFPSV